MHKLTMRNGDKLDALGLGTWKSAPDQVRQAVTTALELGYRHIDCARVYGNESEIGEALAAAFTAGVVERSEVWITSKLWNDSHAPEDVRPALEKTLADLGLESLDLYLMHWPVALRKGASFPLDAGDLISLEAMPLADTWSAMEDCVDAGLCRHIGVSNFSVEKLAALGESARTWPAMNQVELHPYLQQQALVDYCASKGILVTAYSPLGSPDRPATLKTQDEPILLEEPAVNAIAAELDATPAQVLLRWGIERGTAVIPKSVNPARLAENLAAAELSLGPAHMEALAELDRHRRYVSGSFWEVEGTSYSMASLWDER